MPKETKNKLKILKIFSFNYIKIKLNMNFKINKILIIYSILNKTNFLDFWFFHYFFNFY
jgi:hypothetical protein